MDAAERAVRYYESLPRRRVAPGPEQLAGVEALEEPLPDGPCSAREVLAKLDDVGSPASMAMAGPRFFGFVIGGALPAALAANWMAGAWDQANGLYDVTPFTAKLEQVTLAWLLDLLGLPAECGGAFVTGATMASFCGFAPTQAARIRRRAGRFVGDRRP